MNIKATETQLHVSGAANIIFWIGVLFFALGLPIFLSQGIFSGIFSIFSNTVQSMLEFFLSWIFNPLTFAAGLFSTTGAWIMVKYPLIQVTLDKQTRIMTVTSRHFFSKHSRISFDDVQSLEWRVKTMKFTAENIIYHQLVFVLTDGTTLPITGERGVYDPPRQGMIKINDGETGAEISSFLGIPFKRVEMGEDYSKAQIPAKYHNPLTVLKEAKSAMQEDIKKELGKFK